jgi:outer membrane protein TolC
MILRKQILLIAWCLIAAGVLNVSSQNADSLTLERVIDMAVKNSASLNARQKGLSAASARTSQAKGAYFPVVNGTASYANIGPIEKMNFPVAVGIKPDPVTGRDGLVMQNIPFQLYPGNNWDIHIGADYLLYDFGRRKKTVELSAIGEQGVQTGAALDAKGIAYLAIIMFESIMNSDHMIKAKNEDVSNLSQHLEFVRKKLSTGSATQFDVLRSEVQLMNSQTDLTNLANDRDKQQIDFRQTTGLPETAPVILKGAFDSSYQELSSDTLVAQALKNRTEIDLLNIAVKALQAQIALAKADLLPALSAHASVGEKNGYVPDLDKLQLNWVMGGQLQVPIFDGRRSHFRTRELESRIDSLQIMLKDVKDRMRTEVLKAIADVKSAHQNFIAAKTNVGLAGESRRIANLQYEAGVIPNLDLLDAEDKFIQAKFAQLQSEFRYALSRYALMRVTGFDFTELSKGAEKNDRRR